MKTKKRELDVDFIGGQKPLTEIEMKELSEFIQKRNFFLKEQGLFVGKSSMKKRKIPVSIEID